MPTRRGRPPKYDDSALARVFSLVATGRSLSDACREVGLSPRTVHRRAERDPAVADRLRAAQAAGGDGKQKPPSRPDADGSAIETLCDELSACWAAEMDPPAARGGQNGSTPIRVIKT